jgi:mRNA-degrading endonuclease RelE of RelBE toxin-antitoxin system
VFTFVETKLFTQLVRQYLADDEYAALQRAIVANPEAGDVIRGSGGVRKLRWGVDGRGKRGGIRIIYYLRTRQGQVWMLTLYAKNEAESIPEPVLKKIKEEPRWRRVSGLSAKRFSRAFSSSNVVSMGAS